MLTLGRAAYQKELRYAEYAGLSTDNKLDPAIAPVLQNGDVFKEIDTGATFKYNAASGQWVEQPASGGGGGTPGPAGQNGVTFTPSVSETGVLSWTNNGGLDNPDPVNIMGPQGLQGVQGEPGKNGMDGTDGENGATFTPSVSPEGVISWTNDKQLANPESVNIKGPQGTRGENGYYFTPDVSQTGDLSWTNNGGLQNPSTVNIKGPQGEPGKTPEKGVDYWTETDKEEIVAETVAALPVYNGEVQGGA